MKAFVYHVQVNVRAAAISLPFYRDLLGYLDPTGRLVEIGARTRTIPSALRRARHEAQGPEPHRAGGVLRLARERLDLGWAIDVLHPMAARPRPCSSPEQGPPGGPG